MSDGEPLVPFILKLRRNIVQEGDLFLARMELEALLGHSVVDVPCVEDLLERIPELAGLPGCAALERNVRADGVQALLTEAPLATIGGLIPRVSFIQQIYCVVELTDRVRDTVRQLNRRWGDVLVLHERRDRGMILALPHYLLFELSETVIRRSASPADCKRNLDRVKSALLGQDREGAALADEALSAGTSTSHLSHGLHYYKAKFFPRLARSLLNAGVPAETSAPCRVLDSFVGSGTTLVEASTLGISSVGVDIDPLSVLISSAKIDLMGLNSSWYRDESDEILQRLSVPSFPRSISQASAFPFPTWLMKNRKMSEEAADEIGAEIVSLRSALSGSDPALQNLLQVLLSDALTRKVRMRLLGTGCGRFSLHIAKTPLADLFIRSLRQSQKVAAAWEWLRETLHLSPAPAQALQGDARCLPQATATFDFLLTSPPYLPASSGRESYAKAHALSLIALGMKDLTTLEALECDAVGAMGETGADSTGLRPREREVVEWLRGDSLRSVKAEPTARYFHDLRRAFSEMSRVLKPGAHAVVVSGKQSTFYRYSTREALYVVPCAELLAEEAQDAGFEVEALHDLRLQKASRNARPRSLDDYYETLIFLKKTN